MKIFIFFCETKSVVVIWRTGTCWETTRWELEAGRSPRLQLAASKLSSKQLRREDAACGLWQANRLCGRGRQSRDSGQPHLHPGGQVTLDPWITCAQLPEPFLQWAQQDCQPPLFSTEGDILVIIEFKKETFIILQGKLDDLALDERVYQVDPCFLDNCQAPCSHTWKSAGDEEAGRSRDATHHLHRVPPCCPGSLLQFAVLVVCYSLLS